MNDFIKEFNIDTERNMAIQFLRSKGVVDERTVEWLIEYSHMCGHFINKVMKNYQDHLSTCTPDTFYYNHILRP